METKITAYAWASGLIEFGETFPDGALPIITGEEKRVREIIEVRARHSRKNEQMLVPGVPEADNQHDACDALIRFTESVTKEYVEK
ncbi:host nuclease inhibitor protein [Raoultella ornithinolytica]|uniref:host nuclease inhibitor protein n=1 Tax=Klebsiella/Raoultella group TaxID=2890311 RepID=UPI000CF30D5E|nr:MULTISPECIES: host nuclease inhibitor protein [Klebsiella/Raoultella group]PQH22682.1 host nuclease inhibitor protein [Raoultella ornithinolytica]